MTEETKISMSQKDFNKAVDDAVENAVTKVKVDSLTTSFSNHEAREEKYLMDISENLKDVQLQIGNWKLKLTECKNELHEEIMGNVTDTYMTKKDGLLLEQHLASNIKSIRLWIVATVGGFTSAGILVAWLLGVVSHMPT